MAAASHIDIHVAYPRHARVIPNPDRHANRTDPACRGRPRVLL
ncbi:hypothetical protein BURMUCGD2_5239 [Burkholderia multivorans CGD2]|uniref:Uncharacterized protein n=1 Tax=Burkholderia multivorans CGD2 TaxID=513052 RepID=B9BJI3_9BURK|nr:hypothetical protein BURMUCGD2_5239 [Burkholderia multivorans CGD2]